VQRRRFMRTKRRIPCEFPYDGHLAHGIVTDVSPGGLFVQTDATPDPGEELEVHLKGSSTFPELTLRVVVARRRLTPARLASIMPRGLGLRLLEVPPEYLEALGESAAGVEAPVASASSEAPGGEAAGGAWEDEFDFIGFKPPDPSATTDAAAPPTEASPPPSESPRAAPELKPSEAPRGRFLPFPADDAWLLPATPESCSAVVFDEGELDDVFATLEEIGARPERYRRGDASGFHGWERPPRVFVVAARTGLSLRIPSNARAEGVVSIAIAERDSHTLCASMRRRGFQYIVRRPVHPEALRLLLLGALYRDRDMRSEPRYAVGCEVSWRQGLHRRRGTLLDISASGCRLLSDEIVKSSSRALIRVPPEAAGGRALNLRGRLIRCVRQGADGPYAIAMRFEGMSSRAQRRLTDLLAVRAVGPSVLPRPSAGTPVAPAEPPTPELAAPEAPTPEERRRNARVALQHEVLALDAQSQRVLHTLVGCDLSEQGVRVEPHPLIAYGDRLRLGLYDAAHPEPIVLDAEVVRDDGDRGLAIRFVEPGRGERRKLRQLVESLPAIETRRMPGASHQPIVIGEILGHRAVG
jgi:PilZ domain